MDQVAPLAVPCEVHPEVWAIDAGTDAWARRTGLVTGDADSSPLGRARFGRMAARVFPAAETDRVELFSRWLTWLFAFDDARDDGQLGASATAVDALYSRLLMAIRRGHPRPEAGPLEVTLTQLWNTTARLMTAGWRQRFLRHLEDHRRACSEEAVHRRTGHIPSVSEYPMLRRRGSGLFMYDLAEPVLGVQLSEAIVRSPTWQTLVQAIADLVTWSNDVVSYPREATPHNYLTVFAQAYGLEAGQTGSWVVARIAERAPEMEAAVRLLPAAYLRLGLDEAERSGADEVAATLLGVPRAHLEWLLESGRYDAPEEPGPRRESMLSLRDQAEPRRVSPRSRSLAGP